MLSRWIESLLINIINNPKGVRSLGHRPQTRALPTPSGAGDVLVGHAIPIELETVTITQAERRRHVYILGATGSGKTNLMLRLIDADIATGTNFCVIDLRGDFVDRILPRLAAGREAVGVGKRLLLIDLREDAVCVGFNPLAGEGDTFSRAYAVLAILKQYSESLSWGVQLEETLRNCLLALAETGWTLLEIEPLLSNQAFRSEVLAGVSEPYVRSFFARYEELSADKRLNWSLPVLNKITPFIAHPQLRHMLGQRQGLPLTSLLNDQAGSIVLVSLAVDRLHQAGLLAGTLIASSLQGAILSRVDLPEKDRLPTNFYIDEFETMATDRFETVIAEGRRFGLGLCLAHQNLSQLSSNLRKALLNNVQTQFYFQTGASDAAELARELSSTERRETLRSILLSQGVGEAFLVRRGKASTRVKVLRADDPPSNHDALSLLREASFATFARPRADVELELSRRTDRLSSIAGGPSPAGGPPIYEIRHAKTEDFKPKRRR